ncbi:hypothetical protein RB594_003909 [Gaeumannomyces avenae]
MAITPPTTDGSSTAASSRPAFAPERKDAAAASLSGTGIDTGTGAGPPGVMVFDGFQQRSVKRPRPVKSCLLCRSKKLRCDRLNPCSQCQKSHRVCRYANDQGPGNASDSGSDGETASPSAAAADRGAPAHKRVALAGGLNPRSPAGAPIPPLPTSPQPPVDAAVDVYYRSGFDDIAARLDRLERLIMASRTGEDVSSALVQGPPPPPLLSGAATGSYGTGTAASGLTPAPPAGQEWAASPGASPSYSYDSAPPPVGGGAPGSRIAALTSIATRSLTSPVTVRGLTIKGARSLRTRFFGQNSTRVLLNLFGEAKDFMYNKAKRESANELFVHLQKIYTVLQEDQHRVLAPITVFVDSVLPVLKRMADILPTQKSVCDRLLEAYIGTSEGLYRVVHVPTLRAEYQAYWDGQRCSDGFLPQLLCMLSIGSRFQTESRGLGHDRSEGVHVPTACALVRAWLDSLRGKQLVDVGTLLAEVLLLHAQRMITPRYQDSWTQLGVIVRMAMTMGLHRDPSEFPQISPFAAECRRKLWYTIMDMDLHLSLGCNLPCAVRDGEYTCQPPLNLDDEDLRPDSGSLPPSKPIEVRTDGQLQAWAASTLPIRMRAAALVSQLDSIRDYGEVLEVGSRLERLLEEVNLIFPRGQGLDPRWRFKEWRMRALLDMHIRRPLLALYRPFALSTPDCPPQIASTYFRSSMVLLTYMDELDARTPGFVDVNHMYHVILKHDIIQAAFSVCYYIKNAQEAAAAAATSNGASGSTAYNGIASSLSPSMANTTGGDGIAADANDNNSSNIAFDANGRPLWPPERMMRVVEKTLEDVVQLIRDSTSDLKDIVALSIVINSVRPGGSPEQRLERIRAGIERILDACLKSLKTTPEGLCVTALPSAAAAAAASSCMFATAGKSKSPAAAAGADVRPGPPHSDQPQPPFFHANTHLPAGTYHTSTTGFPDDFPLWDANFWGQTQPDM